MARSSKLVREQVNLQVKQDGSFDNTGTDISTTALQNAIIEISQNLPLLDITNLPQSSDILSYWKLDEESGTRADLLGNHNLLEQGSVGFQAGILGNEAVLSGNSNYLEAPTIPVPSGSFSISLWGTVNNTGGNRIIASHYDFGAGANATWYLWWSSSGELRFSIRRGGGSAITTPAIGSISNNTRFHVAVSYNSSTGNVAIGLNGSSYQIGTGGVGALNNTSASFRLSGADGISLPLDGKIDEFCYWDGVALATREIDDLYNSGSGLFPQTGISYQSERVKVGLTPANYTAAEQNLEEHLIGVDGKFGTVDTTLTSLQSQISGFSGGEDYFFTTYDGSVPFTTATDAMCIGESALCSSVANFSFAAGRGAQALGVNATALGRSSQAGGSSAPDCTAVGYLAIATGTTSTAIGHDAQATGIQTTALGSLCQATGTNAFAFGYFARATMTDSMCLGKGLNQASNAICISVGTPTISGSGSIFIGNAPVAEVIPASATTSIVIGDADITANGSNAVVIGQSATSSGDNTVSIGFSAVAAANNSIAIGNSAQLTDGDDAIAIGYNITSEGNNNICIGENITQGFGASFSTLIGNNITNSSGDGAVAIGSGITGAIGNTAVIIGAQSEGSNDNTVAIGYQAVATGVNAVQLGTGTNNTASTLQFLTNTIADSNGLNGSALPAYDDDAAAGVGGLTAGQMYQTTGSGAAPLNAAGIVMVKQ